MRPVVPPVRVRVCIPEEHRPWWNRAAFDAMQGQAGDVTAALAMTPHEIALHKERTGRDVTESRLVVFDRALPPLWSSGWPVSGFWFSEDEIEVIA